jgi:hypothetical protein
MQMRDTEVPKNSHQSPFRGDNCEKAQRRTSPLPVCQFPDDQKKQGVSIHLFEDR